MAVRCTHARRSGKSGNEKYIYYFDILKCRKCKHSALCGYRKGQQAKTYGVIIKTEQQEKQLKAQQSGKFKEEYGIRFIVEAKNSEIKNSYHLDRAISYGLDAYTMQGAVAFFTSNLVRITRIMDGMSEK